MITDKRLLLIIDLLDHQNCIATIETARGAPEECNDEVLSLCTELLASRKRIALFERFGLVVAQSVDAAIDGNTDREQELDNQLVPMCAELWPDGITPT